MTEKKKATDMTTEELARRVFPPEVVEELQRIANDEPSKPRRNQPHSESK